MFYESAQLRVQSFYMSKVHLSLFVCTPTALAISKKPTCRSILWPTYGYSYLRRKIWHYQSALTAETPYDWCTLTTTNVWRSEVHLRRRHPTIEGHWGWQVFPSLNQIYSCDTLRSVKCICGQRPTKLRRLSTTTTMTTMTDDLGAQGLWTIESAIDKSSINDPFTLSKQKNIGDAGTNGDSGRTCKSISMQHINTGFGTHSSWSPNTRQKWRDAMCMGYWQLSRNPHLCDTDAFQATWNITTGGTHHNPCHDWRCDATCKGQLEDADHSPVLGLSHTGRQMRHASHANVGVRFSTWHTLIPKHNPDIDWARLTPCYHGVRVVRRNDTDNYGSGIEGLTSW